MHHLKKKLIPLLFLNAVVGFTIPADQEDGVYMVHYDDAGEAVHTWLHGPVNESEITEAATKRDGLLRIARRDSDSVDCGGYDLAHADTDNAVEALKRQCDPSGAISQGLDFYSIAGSTVAYECNFGNKAVICTRNEQGGSFDKITGVCGSYRAGWRTIQNSAAWYSIGYEDRGAKFCGRGP
ncbi:hypothetical protein GQ53DRAFT_825529 [Thozetella sp. PMI_491]|nr:hypothetical protein GQ53DRAFT_825529 [Thozetella sp. PMI_491]